MKKANAKQIGIEINYGSGPNRLASGGYVEFSAGFYITSAPSSENFIPIKKLPKSIMKRIKKHLKGFGENSKLDYRMNIGIMEVSVQHETLYWNYYYPLHFAPEYLKSKGIANLLELLLLKEAKKRFPQIKLVKHLPTTELRVIQAKKRGLKAIDKYTLEEYTFEEAVAKLEKKIKTDRGKARQRISLAKRINANRKNPKTRRTKQIKRMQFRMAA